MTDTKVLVGKIASTGGNTVSLYRKTQHSYTDDGKEILEAEIMMSVYTRPEETIRVSEKTKRRVRGLLSRHGMLMISCQVIAVGYDGTDRTYLLVDCYKK